VFTADFVMKKEGYTKCVKIIRSLNGKCKIAILGGSHSAFSIIYTLLNGPCKINCFEEHLKKQKQTRKINSAIVNNGDFKSK
jgi:hypothetical protein